MQWESQSHMGSSMQALRVMFLMSPVLTIPAKASDIQVKRNHPDDFQPCEHNQDSSSKERKRNVNMGNQKACYIVNSCFWTDVQRNEISLTLSTFRLEKQKCCLRLRTSFGENIRCIPQAWFGSDVLDLWGFHILHLVPLKFTPNSPGNTGPGEQKTDEQNHLLTSFSTNSKY